MIPVLYEKTERDFDTLGLGFLPDWIEGTLQVVEERNGEFYLEGDLPAGALNVNELSIDRIIYALPARGADPQPFRIQQISKPEDGNVVHVMAPHVSYQLAQSVLKPLRFTIEAGDSVQTIVGSVLWLYGIPSIYSLVGEKFFFFESDITATADQTFDTRTESKFVSIREALSGMEGSIVDLVGGELEWDRWTVKLLQSRGTNAGKVIQYGRNLASVSFDTDALGMVTAYLGFCNNESGNRIDSTLVRTSDAANFAYPRVNVIDLTEYFQSLAGEGETVNPTLGDVQAATEAYAAAHPGNLETSITVEVVPEELQDLHLCDTVFVVHPGYGIYQSSKVVKTVFDPINERFTSLTIGEMQKSVTDTIMQLLSDAKDASSSVAAASSDALVDNACAGWKGFGVGWDVAKNGRTIQMSRSEFEPEHGDQTQTLTWQKATGADFWYTPQLERPLDMPLEPYNAVLAGMSDRLFVTSVFAADFTNTRTKFRLGSPVNPSTYDAGSPEFPMSRPYIRLHASGRRALPPQTASLYCINSNTQSVNLATIAKTYVTARAGGRAFVYGDNWPYRRSDAVNNEDGAALVECDTIALMALIGMRYANSPYTNTAANATADFDTVMAAWDANSASSQIPWYSETQELVMQISGAWSNGLGGRIVDQGAMTWWFWDNGYAFRPEVKDENGDYQLDLTQLRSGDLVMFRRVKSTYFDNVSHIGVIEIENGTVYIIHATWGPWTSDQVVVRSKLMDEFFNIAPGRYRPEDMYFARIPYGSTGDPTGSRIEPASN